MPGGISQPNIYLGFPGENVVLMPTDLITLEMERIASVVPLPGNSDSGLPRFFWVDLGLTNYSIIMQGTFKDFGGINPFQIVEKFMHAWRGNMFNLSTNVDPNDLTHIQIDDATWGRQDYYCINSKVDLTRQGGKIQWDYYMRFAVVLPTNVGTYNSFAVTDPISGFGPSVHVGFPVVGGQTTLQVDDIQLNYDRMASTIPLPGDEDENRPRLAYTDLGLAQPILTLKGKLPDILTPNPFEVMEAFYRNWSGRIAGDSRTDDHVAGLLGMCLDDPQGTRAFFGVPQKMRLIRQGGTSNWKFEMSMWVVRGDESGV